MQQRHWAGTKLRATVPAAVALVLLAAAIAGCVHPGDDDPQVIERDRPRDREGAAPVDDDEEPVDGNETVEPVLRPPPPPPIIILDLNATMQAGWAGDDEFVFNATTVVENGNATRWHFEFGDGASVTIEAPEEPSATHTFEAGGSYTVNVTVEAEGAAGANETLTATTSESLVVHVHERQAITAGSLASLPAVEPEVSDDLPFQVAAGGVHARAEVTVENTGIIPASGRIEILDPTGEVIVESGFSVPFNQERDVLVGHGLDNTTGEHTVRINLTQGEIEYSGTIAVYYGVPPEE